jgi:hypothetical protein
MANAVVPCEIRGSFGHSQGQSSSNSDWKPALTCACAHKVSLHTPGQCRALEGGLVGFVWFVCAPWFYSCSSIAGQCCTGIGEAGTGRDQGVSWAKAKVRSVPDIRLGPCSDLCLCSGGVPCSALVDDGDGGSHDSAGLSCMSVCVCGWVGG